MYTYRQYNNPNNTQDKIKIGVFVLLGGCMLFFITDCASGRIMGKGTARYAEVKDKEYDRREYRDDDGHWHTDEQWILKVLVAGEKHKNVDVSHGQYDSVKIGDMVLLTQNYGGITGWSYGYSFEMKAKTVPMEGGK